jgi:hypothetical protein
LDDPTTYLNHSPFFQRSLFGAVLGPTATPRRAIVSISVVAISSIVVMRGCRKYRLDPLPQSSTGIRSHLVHFPVFRSPSFTSSRCRCVGFVKFSNLFRFCLWLRFVLSRLQNHTAFIIHVYAQHFPSNLSPSQSPGLPGLHTTYSPLPPIINHKRQYMFIHKHLTVRILDGVIREAVIYVHPL